MAERAPWDTDAHRERYAKVLRREVPLEDAIGETLDEMADDLVADVDRLLKGSADRAAFPRKDRD